MQEILELSSKVSDPPELNTKARVEDCSNSIVVGDDGLDIFLNGKKVAAIEKMQHERVSSFRSAIRSVKYARERRLSGVYSGQNKTFGFMPANGLFRRHCGVTAMYSKQRKEFVELCEQAKHAEAFLQKHFPDQHETAKSFVEESVLDCWRLSGSIFTGGIANKNNPIDYHVDKANAAGTMAVMASFRCSSVRGGWLCLPEYDLRLMLPDSSWFAFPNSDWVHGVSPIQGGQRGGRFSAVFFTNDRMAKCGTPVEELKKARAHDMKKLKK